MLIDRSQTLGSLVLEHPTSTRVLERLGLDYCCGGRQTLAEACAGQGLDAATVAVFLERDVEPIAAESADWAAAPLTELCTHIIEAHHGRLRWELPRLGTLAERAADAHGEAQPALRGIRDELARLREELEQHIGEEERDLFPALGRGQTLAPGELERLRVEHETTGARLHRLRELADNYDSAMALCNVHRALLQGLHGLELDLHQHVHEENNILFPRALAPGHAWLFGGKMHRDTV